MLDKSLIKLIHRPLQQIGIQCVSFGIRADQVTIGGFLCGMSAIPFIVTQHYFLALLCIGFNRLADGLDGAIARLTAPTYRGAFLDIVCDFLFYSAIPLAFALADPSRNALAASVLIYSFVGTGCSFLAFAVLAAKQGLTSTDYPNKGFYYLGGLTEATETILLFVLMCLFPSWFSWLAYGFAGLCLLTLLTRIWAGVQLFSSND
jgi:phosphatidylglycerophosphate synthase